MDIRFLQSLVAVVETGSIAAAARRENLTAAAVSQRIQTLERILGCELLNRSAHAVLPSEQCLALLPKVRTLIQLESELHDELDARCLSGDLRIGAISTALTGILPEVMEQLAIDAPALRLRITPGDSRMLYERVVQGDLDAAILVQPPFALPKTIRQTLLRAEPLLLLSKIPVAATDIHMTLCRQPMICYDTQAWGGQSALHYLKDHALSPEVLCELDALEAISILVAKGIGVSLVPEWAGLSVDAVHATLVSGSRDYMRRVVLLYPVNSRRPRAVSALESLLTQMSRAPASPS
ncbi:LysR family transcriptional regulator [Vogesella indigofera]|uniref:LysR family transcriptional regulator n=1 Tax=Vogesella indigofera TaxID=45465 RepID=UPI00234E7387|nr:LysR family transcriptional regulator [Vogesella indigofera]MDC7712354.1 LysR family transcriptional regulator [Vogesella indigofera]